MKTIIAIAPLILMGKLAVGAMPAAGYAYAPILRGNPRQAIAPLKYRVNIYHLWLH